MTFKRGDRVNFNKGVTGTIIGEAVCDLSYISADYVAHDRQRFVVALDTPFRQLKPVEIQISVLVVAAENMTKI